MIREVENTCNYFITTFGFLIFLNCLLWGEVETTEDTWVKPVLPSFPLSKGIPGGKCTWLCVVATDIEY